MTGLVSGHGFSRATALWKGTGLSPLVMARPSRHASPEAIPSTARTFFATTETSQGRLLLQSERNATLPIDVLRSYPRAGKFRLHDFLVMPAHVHLLMTVGGSITVDKAMQVIKGGFS
jgi:putative transposase